VVLPACRKAVKGRIAQVQSALLRCWVGWALGKL
jgi:hypothetical protein